MRNIVTRALGSRSEVATDVVEEAVQAGDLFVICSDGLNTMLDDEEIGDVLRQHPADPPGACAALVAAANANGGDDNVTVIAVAFA
jgi:protein phosphatase